jgi:hypothetical protein
MSTRLSKYIVHGSTFKFWWLGDFISIKKLIRVFSKLFLALLLTGVACIPVGFLDDDSIGKVILPLIGELFILNLVNLSSHTFQVKMMEFFIN